MHLSDMPRVSLVCKALEIDYAVAMTGFETRGGQSVPVFDGVVVCEEHAEVVQEKYWAAERCGSTMQYPFDAPLFFCSHLQEQLLAAGRSWSPLLY